MGIKTNSFQKGNKDLLPQISHDVQSSNTLSDEDGSRIYGSCFNNIGNIRIVIDEISKWTTIDYSVSVVMATHYFKYLNIITQKPFKSSPRISVVEIPQSQGGDRRATGFNRPVLTVSDIRRNAKAFSPRKRNLS
jgi:hypothetical protein